MTYLYTVPECRNLPGNRYINGRTLPAKAMAGLLRNPDRILWIAFAFESVGYESMKRYFSMVGLNVLFSKEEDWVRHKV